MYAYRQYFENSTIENCFVGYSTEATALVVVIVTEELHSSTPYQELWEKVLVYIVF